MPCLHRTPGVYCGLRSHESPLALSNPRQHPGRKRPARCAGLQLPIIRLIAGGPELVTDYLRTFRLFHRDVRLFFITAALLGFTQFGGIRAVLLNLYLLRLGLGPETIGLVNAAGMLAFGGFALPAGVLGGRLGTRRTMIAGLCLGVIGFGLLPLADLVPVAVQTGWVLATYVLGWIGTTLHVVNGTPFLMGATSPEERMHVFSAQGALWPLAGFAGSLVGGILPGLFAGALGLSLEHQAPFRYPLLIAAVAMIPAIPAMLATGDVSPARAGETLGRSGPAPYGVIALLTLVVLLRAPGSGVARTFFNVYLDTGLHVTTAQIGALSAAGQLLSVPAVLAAPLLMRRWGTGRTYALSSLGIALSLLPLALIRHWSAAGIGQASVMALALVSNPAITVFHQEIVLPGWRTAIAGATAMAMGLGWSATALGGGYVIAALGYRSLFLMGAGLTVAGVLLFWAYFRVPRGELARRSAPG